MKKLIEKNGANVTNIRLYIVRGKLSDSKTEIRIVDEHKDVFEQTKEQIFKFIEYKMNRCYEGVKLKDLEISEFNYSEGELSAKNFMRKLAIDPKYRHIGHDFKVAQANSNKFKGFSKMGGSKNFRYIVQIMVGRIEYWFYINVGSIASLKKCAGINNFGRGKYEPMDLDKLININPYQTICIVKKEPSTKNQDEIIMFNPKETVKLFELKTLICEMAFSILKNNSELEISPKIKSLNNLETAYKVLSNKERLTSEFFKEKEEKIKKHLEKMKFENDQFEEDDETAYSNVTYYISTQKKMKSFIDEITKYDMYDPIDEKVIEKSKN